MKTRFALFALVALLSVRAGANNLQIANVSLTAVDTVLNYTKVKFDISWDNSWRDFVNWDAAWVIVKYSADGGATWHHAKLNPSVSNHTLPAGCTAVSTPDSLGVFLFRSAAGSGSVNWDNIYLRWEYGSDGVTDNADVLVRVFGIEMVYVPQGSFYVGDGSATLTAQFEDATSGLPKLISSEGAITLGGGGAGSIGNNNKTGQFGSHLDDFNDATPQTLPAVFPKGYNAFYCMKYEITQEQYRDFLNTLTRRQQRNRVGTYIQTTSITQRWVMAGLISQGYRNGLHCDAAQPDTVSPVIFYCDLDSTNGYDQSNDGKNIANNYMSIYDIKGYAAWTGLRPMTELEFEKAARGPRPAAQDEYAWGSNSITGATGLTNGGQGSEIASNAGANCNSGSGLSPLGPMRAGAFATVASDRQMAGAGYYGAMDLSGNLYEQCITIGNSGGRSFTGTHGSGELTPDGWAVVSNWPSYIGFGKRAGAFSQSSPYERTSDRYNANYYDTNGLNTSGGRCVRTAP
jgi:formylglycine-generating enzyme required for sulfatase activity